MEYDKLSEDQGGMKKLESKERESAVERESGEDGKLRK
jgi:hypothetical protein